MMIAQTLREWRDADEFGHGVFSQSVAAEFLGVPLKTYQDWEQGRGEPGQLALSALLLKIKKKPKLRRKAKAK